MMYQFNRKADLDVLKELCKNHICVEADGLPVLDDVGGVHGYVDFLVTTHHSADESEREDAREWARSLGWTGRVSKPQYIL